MKTKLDRQLHGHTRPSLRNRKGFFTSNRQRNSFFWFLVGDSGAYFLVFFILGKIIGACLIYYILFWPIIKGIFLD